MKKYDKLFLVVFAVSVLLGIVCKLNAAPGWENATRVEIGTYINTRVVTGSSYTGTAMWSGTTLRPDGQCLNNSGGVIWVGTNTVATTGTTVHENIRIGFPVLSTQPFSLGGSYTGSLNFTCNPGTASCEVRCVDGLVYR